MVNVSIIVPVYNVEKYLLQCLNSILSQTLYNIEIICIDDGSTDGSGQIIDTVASKDKRVKVIHQANAGYGASMNAGLDMAVGEYIGVVESDDYILPDMFESLYRAAVQNDLDMVKSDAYYWIETEDFLSRIHSRSMDSLYDKVLDGWDRNYFFAFYMNIWTGIYKRDFLTDHAIRFHESPGASYQDNGFWMQTCIYADRAMWLNKAFYYYRQDNPLASVKDPGKIMAMSDEYEYIERLLKSRGQEIYLPYCYIWKMIRHKGTYGRIADEKKREFCRKIQLDYKKYRPYISGLMYLDLFFVPLVKKPDEAIEALIRMKQDIRDKLSAADGIVIYGAGFHGELIYRILYNEGYASKVVCYAVTSDLKSSQVGKKKLMLIQEATELYQDACYIIAVQSMSTAYREMIEKLEALQINDFIDGTCIENNFYYI